MWPSKPPKDKATFKEIFDVLQSLVTVGAVLVGGWWTYLLFIKERRDLPHLNIEHQLSHLDLSKDIRILRVGVVLNNSGSTHVVIGNAIIRVQQVLPTLPCPSQGSCVATELNTALKKTISERDGFSWPLLAKREFTVADWQQIEPGEKQPVDFEFAIPSDVQFVRVYTFFRNDRAEKKCPQGAPKHDASGEKCAQAGWGLSSYYDFRATSKKGEEK